MKFLNIPEDLIMQKILHQYWYPNRIIFRLCVDLKSTWWSLNELVLVNYNLQCPKYSFVFVQITIQKDIKNKHFQFYCHTNFIHIFFEVMNFFGRLKFRRLFASLVQDKYNFAKECETVLNKQINLELKAFYRYLAMVR